LILKLFFKIYITFNYFKYFTLIVRELLGLGSVDFGSRKEIHDSLPHLGKVFVFW
jgi:hypothetical protein